MTRFFVAIKPPETICAQAASFADAKLQGARWSAQDSLHVTLKFLGDVFDIGVVERALQTVQTEALKLKLEQVGIFGSPPSTLWVGVSPKSGLVELASKIDAALLPLGFEKELRAYTPHLTIARLKGTPLGSVRKFLAEHANFESDNFEASGFCLFSSRLTPNGPIYQIQHVFPA